MKLSINLSCDTQAFEDDFAGELRRILGAVADDLLAEALAGSRVTIRDRDGTAVGEWRLALGR